MYFGFLSGLAALLFLFVIVYRARVPKVFVPYYRYPTPNKKFMVKEQVIEGPIIPMMVPKIPRPTYKMRQFVVYPSPRSIERKGISNSFNYKSWDGTLWTAYLIDNQFYVKKMGSSRTFKTRVLNILRFRSQQWQMAYLPYKNMFMVFRFNGITGIPYKKIDLVGWDDYTQDIELGNEVTVSI
jgi:hypothetical protein